ncbi:uncharacterized protein PFL1_00312 [Pseudozyma flocculosa PF-1]|uniref:Protein transport protein SFT2 n=1 Tax=Pseudozyma flocculosa TaxID=84751 RepID=A0A5C3EV51_9BASI|nr:uncharacterized protein PFL1_00312 [Pseudozyma flocculosa PF-1]EPQ32115.1 hypothetical protein PFL1_00312 [Pseudozyma flocculosa PF-1]SPO34951.1 uncharacterized protein PSFLO_00422 [Pseudozyma flocculosa]
MSSWLPGGGSGGGGGAFAGTGASRWINMDTNQVKNLGGELTGENDAFSKKLGIDLTRQQRMIGFGACLGIGFVMSILGSVFLFTGSLVSFAILYSVGVVVSLTGTGFLLGFMKQFRQMFAKVRIAFTLAMIAAFIMVWVSAFAIGSAIVSLIFVVVLYVAFTLYSLSYIPYCIDLLKRMANKFF